MINNTAKNPNLHQFTRTIITAKIHRIALLKKNTLPFYLLPRAKYLLHFINMYLAY